MHPAFRLSTRAFWQLLALGLLLACARAHAFDFESLSRLARQRAAAPSSDAPVPLPPALAELDYDGRRDIRFQPAQALWRDAGLPFEAMFFHRAGPNSPAVRIHEVAPDGTERALPYRRADFDFGKNRIDGFPSDDIGHAGFRLHYPLNNTAYKDELVVFLGASYFRALGAGQQYGLSARGLAIDTVGGASEEFPRFTDFWLERPACADAREVVIFALLDSPRATGAYRFVLKPGKQTAMEVHARLFLRGSGTPIATLGLAPLTSMFLFGENQPRAGDFRPEVHDSDGLMVASAGGEWLWRPLQNPAQIQVNSFSVDGLRGFGLMQRDRAFASYEDVEARYERRPSAWVRPLGEWGPGRVELVQLSTPDETHDNVVAYWVPAKLPAAGEPLDFSYELSWQGDEQQRPPGAWAQQTRQGMGYVRYPATRAGQVQYLVDFTGPAFQGLAADAPVRPVATADANGRIEEQLAYFNAATQTWRMTLRVSRIDAMRPVELRAFLQHGNDILTETWTNIILPAAAR